MSLSPLETATNGGGKAADVQQRPEKKDKRFHCERCERRFARLEHLQRHLRTHTQEKPFACQQCDQRFSRSDLLVRHERLNHDPDKNSQPGSKGASSGSAAASNQHKRRKTVEHTTFPTPLPPGANITPTYNAYAGSGALQLQQSPFQTQQSMSDPQDMPFATLLIAAEQANQPTYQTHPPPLPQQHSVQTPSQQLSSNPLPSQEYVGGAYDLEDSLQDLAAFMDNGPLSTYHFSSFISAEQPIPFFSPESFSHAAEVLPSTEQQDQGVGDPQSSETVDDQGSFSRYGSRLPSLQPDERATEKRSEGRGGAKIGDVTQEDRQILLAKLAEFEAVVPRTFQLPSRLALSRYLTGYVNGFHEHMPLLHIPTMTADSCCVDLVLAMAAVGAQYCFEGEKGVELFHVSRSIANQRIRQRDARLAAFHKHSESQYPGGGTSGYRSDRVDDTPRSMSISGHLGLPSQSEDAGAPLQREDLIQTAQALFILMAMATWGEAPGNLAGSACHSKRSRNISPRRWLQSHFTA